MANRLTPIDMINLTQKYFAIIVFIAFLSSCGGSNNGFEPSTVSTNGLLHITWVAPIEREDGTPIILSEIETYNVYYGNSPGDYQYQIDNSEVVIDNIYIPNFPSGTYYFVVTTVTTDGLESRYSEEVFVQI